MNSAALSALADLCDVLDGADDADAVWRALDASLQAQLGHKLFTVLRIDPGEQWSERIYSSQPGAFVSQGRKSLDDAPQMRRVIAAGRPLIVDGEAAVRAAFPDHSRILALDCACVLNVPLRWQGRTLANLNILDEAGHYGEAEAAFAWVAGRLCLPSLLR